MDGQSLNIKQVTLKKLQEIIPHCFTEDKLDWEKLRVFFEDNIEFKNERYHLSWAGKTDAIRLLQTPTYKTLKPCKEESVNFDETENLFIEGDNLEVLKVLQKSYFGKVKMIYIDPPYNTGNDFIYKDDFSETLTEYRKKVGDVDENGNATKARLFKNTKENGHYHSNWLNMMYPRLFLARNLLRDDGVIFVSIDDNEVHNLRLLMDEIFGEENFVGMFTWQKKTQPSFISSEIASVTEYILLYKKTSTNLSLKGGYTNPDKLGELINIGNPIGTRTFKKEAVIVIDFNFNGTISKGIYGNGVLQIELIEDIEVIKGKPTKDILLKGRFNRSQKTLDEDFNNGAIVFIKSLKTLRPTIKFNLNEPKIKAPISLLSKYLNPEIPTNTDASNEMKFLFNGINFMDFPKPHKLIKYLIDMVNFDDKESIILDFFAGSGTTAHAVMELNKEDGGNRRFILVQLPEPTAPESEAYKAGYKTIAEIAKERIRRAAKKIHEELNEEQKKKDGELPLEQTETKKLDLGFKVFKLDESNFKQWRPFRPENAEQIKQAVMEFSENVKPDATTENMLYELMLKNGKKLTDKIEKKNSFYVINENELVLLLEEINKAIVDEIIKLKPQKVIALDKIFNGNDQLKTNTVLQFKDAGIEFKSV